MEDSEEEDDRIQVIKNKFDMGDDDDEIEDSENANDEDSDDYDDDDDDSSEPPEGLLRLNLKWNQPIGLIFWLLNQE